MIVSRQSSMRMLNPCFIKKISRDTIILVLHGKKFLEIQGSLDFKDAAVLKIPF